MSDKHKIDKIAEENALEKLSKLAKERGDTELQTLTGILADVSTEFERSKRPKGGETV